VANSVLLNLPGPIQARHPARLVIFIANRDPDRITSRPKIVAGISACHKVETPYGICFTEIIDIQLVRLRPMPELLIGASSAKWQPPSTVKKWADRS
jgi:hypothetical protein